MREDDSRIFATLNSVSIGKQGYENKKKMEGGGKGKSKDCMTATCLVCPSHSQKAKVIRTE